MLKYNFFAKFQKIVHTELKMALNLPPYFSKLYEKLNLDVLITILGNKKWLSPNSFSSYINNCVYFLNVLLLPW